MTVKQRQRIIRFLMAKDLPECPHLFERLPPVQQELPGEARFVDVWGIRQAAASTPHCHLPMREVSYAFETKGAESVEVVDYRVLHLDGMRGQAFDVMSQLFGLQTAIAHSIVGSISSKYNDSLWIWRVYVVLIDLQIKLRRGLSREPFHFIGFFAFLTRKSGYDKKEQRSCSDTDYLKCNLYGTIRDTLGNRKTK
jgi:hypothetical protein